MAHTWNIDVRTGESRCVSCGTYRGSGLDCHERNPVASSLKFKQIQCVPVPNTQGTQCNVYMYGLDENGKLWFKRDTDMEWQKESCMYVAAIDAATGK